MRLFIAVKVPGDVKNNFRDVYRFLPSDGVKKVSQENIHYTLQFLGEVPEDQVRDITNRLSKVEFNSFTVNVNGIGFFPSEDYVKVVWLGAKDGEKLKELAEKIKESLRPLGFISDKPFSPHLTIARVKRRIKTKELIKKFGDKEFGKFNVSKFYLIKSTLMHKGPVYEIIGEFDAKA